MAVRHNWLPEQVYRLDPHFVEELAAYHRAEAAESRPRTRGSSGAPPGMIVEDVDMSEIV